MGTDRHAAVVFAIGLGCSFDSTGSPSGANTIGGQDTGTTTGSTGAGPNTHAEVTTASPSTDGSDESEGVATANPESTGTTELGTGETGPVPEGLADHGLVARWFLDEAAFGTVPTVAADAADEPFDLPIDFGGKNLSWTEENGHRGLRWMAAEGFGAPLRAIADSKFEMLEGRRFATIEIVAAVDDVTDKDSRLFHIGSGNHAGDFTLRSDALDEVEFVLDGQVLAAWTVDLSTLGRAVFHLVLDTTAAEPGDRVRLYVNGGLEEPVSTNPPEPNAGVVLSASPYLSLGNRDGDRSIAGAVFYAALYAAPLDVDRIEHNATLLFDDDDAD